MPPKVAHYTRGKRKGKFAKRKVAVARENLLASVAETRKHKSSANYFLSQVETDDAQDNVETTAPKTRAIDMVTMGKEMWCKNCDLILSFRNITEEKKKGLASVLTIKCVKYSVSRYVHTFKYDSDTKTYEVNGKLALGMLDAGIGATHVNTLLTSIDMQSVSPSTLKKYERKVGAAIEQVATESCLEAIEIEKSITLEHEPEQLK